ncbi:MAG: AMP-binding protein, partial [Planctomycetota bacterium]
MRPESLDRLLFACNETTKSYPRELSVHGRFEQQVDRSPDAIAVKFGGESLSYAELDARANQMARHLVSLGAKQDSLVGICATRSLDMLAGMLGILKAGAAYLPLDPDYPRERLQLMLEDSAAQIVIAERSFHEIVADGERQLVDFADVTGESSERLDLPHAPESLAYVIYTSGSTGKPK